MATNPFESVDVSVSAAAPNLSGVPYTGGGNTIGMTGGTNHGDPQAQNAAMLYRRSENDRQQRPSSQTLSQDGQLELDDGQNEENLPRINQFDLNGVQSRESLGNPGAGGVDRDGGGGHPARATAGHESGQGQRNAQDAQDRYALEIAR